VAETYWPFANIDTTTTQFSQWSRNIGEGVKGSFNTTDLKVTAPGTGMTVSVAAGQALVRGHYYYNTSAATLNISTANATNPRIDAIVINLDPSVNSAVLTVVAGTPAASPVAPTLTQTDAAVYQFLLATVLVPAAASTIASGNVTDARTFLGQGWFSTPVQDKSANYTVVAGDKFTTIRSTSSAITVTINNVLNVGDRIDFIQDGTGQITFSAGSGVTLQAFGSATKTAGQYAAATVECVASGQYRLIGNIA
jgi:hypothetical protein